MKYEIITPTSTDFNVDRSFEIVQEGFAEAGVKVTQKVGGDTTASYALETDENCDGERSTGYATFDIAMWDWVGYIDPDFMLSVVTKGQWCSWSDTGWDNPDYDAHVPGAGDVDRPGGAEAARLGDAADDLRRLGLHPARRTTSTSTRTRTKWAGIETDLNAYSKKYWTSPHMVE